MALFHGASPVGPFQVSDARAEGTTATEDVFEKIHEVDQKLQYIEKREQEGWQVATRQITQVVENSQKATQAVAQLELKLSRDVQFLEEQLSRDLAVEAQQRAESESRVRQLVLDEAASVRQAIAAAGQQRYSDLDRRVTDVAQSLQDLVGVLEQRVSALQEEAGQVMTRSHDEVLSIEKLVEEAKAERLASDSKLMEALESTCVALHQQIVEERSARVAGQQRLEQLLLETTGKTWVHA